MRALLKIVKRELMNACLESVLEVCLNDSLSHIHGCFALLLILEGIIAQLECLFCLILTKIVKIKPMIAWIEVFVKYV